MAEIVIDKTTASANVMTPREVRAYLIVHGWTGWRYPYPPIPIEEE